MDTSPLVFVSAPELADGDCESRPPILDPILGAGRLCLIYGPSGVGKSLLALGIAWAAASGASFLGWQASRPHKVLYLDGEMSEADLRQRLRLFGPAPPSLSFSLADRTLGPVLDLARLDGLERLVASWDWPELLVIDSLSTLAGLVGIDPERWHELRRFLMALRRAGVSVLVIHHTNRDGDLRGSRRREDAMDLVMALRRPRDWCPRDGARFEIHVEEICGGRAFDPIVAQLCTDAQRPHWQWQSLRGPAIDRAVALLRQGLGAEAMGKAMASHAPRPTGCSAGPGSSAGSPIAIREHER